MMIIMLMTIKIALNHIDNKNYKKTTIIAIAVLVMITAIVTIIIIIS